MTTRTQWRVMVRYRLKSKSYWTRPRLLLVVAASAASASASSIRYVRRFAAHKPIAEYSVVLTLAARVAGGTVALRDITEAAPAPLPLSRDVVQEGGLDRGES